MTDRETFQLHEAAFHRLSVEDRDALLLRAKGRVRALGKTEDSVGYGTRVRLERDRLLVREWPSLFPIEFVRRNDVPVRERHEPHSADREEES